MGLGFFHFARHYSGNHCCFLFLCLLRCFSSARSRIYAVSLQLTRFPHSEICGSIHICWSPQLIAAYHVLHRLWEPRHPPCTLSYFLLHITPFARNGMSFDSCCIFKLKSQESRAKTEASSFFPFSFHLPSHSSPLLLSSLSIYFFQYVKELFL